MVNCSCIDELPNKNLHANNQRHCTINLPSSSPKQEAQGAHLTEHIATSYGLHKDARQILNLEIYQSPLPKGHVHVYPVW